MSGMALLWAEIYESRLNWARRGHDRVLAGLSEQTRASLPKIGEGAVTVVLYGPTQVGKTTLLLTLLGIDEARRQAVDKVLRGKRAHGQSSTPTAMLYMRSPDDQWRFSLNGGDDESMDAAALCTQLEELRKAMMRGEAGDEPAVVSIPAGYFVPQATALPDIRILDLPGGKALAPVEAAYAARLAGHHLRHADLVLLIGRRNALGFLNPDDFTLPGIRDWHCMQDRFLIVTTRSYSLDSVAKWLRQEPAPTLDVLRTTLLQDIASHKIRLENTPGLAERCFPVEFGDSWNELLQTQPDIYAKVTRLRAELLSALQEKLIAAAQPVNRLRRMHQTHEAVARIRTDELKKRWNIQRRKRGGVRQAREKEAALQKMLKMAESEARAMPDDAAIRQVKQKLQAVMLEAMTAAAEPLIAAVGGEKQTWSVDYLLQKAKTCRAKIVHTLTTALEEDLPAHSDERAPNWHAAVATELHGLVTEAFEKARVKLQARIYDLLALCIKHLEDYSFDFYVFDSSYEQDCEQLNAARHAAREVMVDFAVASCTKALTVLTARWRATRAEAAAKIAGLRTAARFAARTTAAREKLRREHASATLAYAHTTRQDRIHAKTYSTIMAEELAGELHARRQALRAETQPAERFLQLLGGLAICNAAQDLRKQL